jgi:amino acid adenylation domain-containing protein
MEVEGLVDRYPLSPLQQGMLFHSLQAPGSGVYVSQLVCALHEALNVPAFEQAWQRVVARHPALRTSIALDGLDEPLQEVRSAARVPLAEHDWRDAPRHERDGRLAAFLDADRRRGFEFGTAPLVRLSLVRLDEAEHWFVWTSHHALMDGRSRRVVLHELFDFYEAICEGRDLHRADPRPYRDYVEWLRRQNLAAAERFWRDGLAGFAAPTPLAVDRTNGGPAEHAPRHAARSVRLPEPATAALRALARSHGLTLNTVVQGAWALLLSRYSGDDDVVFGATRACRWPAASPDDPTVGLFINTLPVRVRVSPDRPLLPWLQELRAHWVAMREHEHTPLVDVRAWSGVAAGRPLFESIVVFEHSSLTAALRARGGRWARRECRVVATTNYPLTVTAYADPELLIEIAYDEHRFDDATVERMLGHLRTLLEGMAADPARRLAELPMVTEQEGRQLVLAWNDTRANQTEQPDRPTVHALVEAQAARTPEAVAVTRDWESLTYAELNRRANRLAHYLRHLGVEPEIVVGICLDRSIDVVVALLGVLKAGGAYLPLDPAYPAARIEYMLADSRASVLVTGERLEGALPAYAGKVVCIDRDWPEIAAQSDANPPGGAARGNAAYVIYTSGSTGRPKGVAIAHESSVAFLAWARTVFDADDLAGVLASTSICFDLSVFELFLPLICGGSVILADDVLHLPHLAAAKKVTLVNTVPSAMGELLGLGPLPASVRAVTFGGEPLPARLVDRVYASGPVRRVLDLYGPTETTTYSTFARREPGGTVTIGRPIANTRVHILDRSLQPVPIGVAGELYIGGAGVARGYLGRPALTAERFVPDPFGGEAGARLYRTGDLARYLADGDIQYLGRLDAQVKVRGFRIEPGEIEAALGAHPAVRECAIVVSGDDPAERQIVAYVAGADGRARRGELRDHLKARLPDHMIPTAFVALDALPRTPNGKVDRRALASAGAAGPAPTAYVAPSTPLQEVIARIWAEVLGRERIGIHDDFFALGGHSLLATRIVARVAAALRTELPLRALFEAPTVAELAERAEAVRRTTPETDAPSIVPAPRGGELPLSFAQELMSFLTALSPDRSLYNISRAVRLTGALNVRALHRALGAIVSRHEVLRTVVASSDGRVHQRVGPSAPPELPVTDLRSWPADEREAVARRLADEEAQCPFDLERGPVFRGRLLRLDRGEHVLVLTMHHVASDGWSVGVLLRELAALYGAFSRGEPSPLPPLPIQYADYAAWQRTGTYDALLRRQLAYWRDRLDGAPPVLELPADRARPAVASHRGASEVVVIPAEATRALDALGRHEGVTRFTTLLAAFQLLLARLTARDDIVVGCPVAGRTRTELEGLIGCFVNMLPLRTDLSGDPTFRELLSRVQEVTLGAFANQELPFERMVQELHPERNPSRTPLVQVLFDMLNFDVPALALPGATAVLMDPWDMRAKFDLTVYVTEVGGAIEMRAVYAADLFEPRTIAHLLEQYLTLLAQIAAAPDAPIGSYSLVTPRSRPILPDPRAPLPEPELPVVTEMFAAQVRRAPERVAIEQGGRRCTYGELAARVDALVGALLARGVQRGDVLALTGPPSASRVAAMLAVLRCGGVMVPIDPQLPDRRKELMLREAGASCLLHVGGVDAGEGWRQEVVPAIEVDESTGLPTGAPLAMATPVEETLAALTPDTPAYVFFTSGSTGVPKGVIGTHKGASHFLAWQHATFGIEPSDRFAHLTSVSFDVVLRDVFQPLVSGATLCIPPRPLGTDEVVSWLAAERITVVHIVPSLARAWLDEAPPGASLPALRWVFHGGEPVLDTLVHRWRRAMPPSAGIVNLYGATETTMAKCFSVVAPEPTPGAQPVGAPLPQTQALVLAGTDRLCGVNEPGEIVMRTPFRTRGYINAPEEQRRRFVVNPFGDRPDDVLYRTGDGGRYRPDGSLMVLGRLDHQVKVRGVRVEPDEIGAALAQHPRVRACVVVGRGSGVQGTALVAYVVADRDEIGTAALRAYLADRLPLAMIPAAFVFLDHLPLTSNGKVDRHALPDPEPSRAESRAAYVAPRTAVEQVLATIWGKVLGVDGVGIHDDFFELGGHSLLAMQVMSRVRASLGLEVPLRTFFQTRSVAELAMCIEAMHWTTRGAGVLQSAGAGNREEGEL